MTESMNSYDCAFDALRSEYSQAHQNRNFTLEDKDFFAIDIRIQGLAKLGTQYLVMMNTIAPQRHLDMYAPWFDFVEGMGLGHRWTNLYLDVSNKILNVFIMILWRG